MTEPPAPSGAIEVHVTPSGRRDGARARAVAAGRAAGRLAGRRGRSGLARLRAWLATPDGHTFAARAGQAAVAGVGVVAAVVLVRRWTALARASAGALGEIVRRAGRRAGAVAGAALRSVGIGWLWSWLARLFGRAGIAGAAPPPRRGHVHCPSCHARVRVDARVCFRCGSRSVGAARVRRGAVRRGAIGVRTVWRVLTGRLLRRCPDCRRLVHADARRCWRCGAGLR